MRALASLAALCLAAAAYAAPAATERHYLSGRGADDAVTWDFFCTAGRASGMWTTIPVPSCWEMQGFGTYDYGVEFRGSAEKPKPPAPDEQGLYRRSFDVPAAWQGRSVRLVFEGVLTDASVKINGQPAGPEHQGGFYRFSYDVADKLRFGAANTIEVTVRKRSANPSINRAEREADYWNFGGIFRPVWLEVRPATAIDRVAIDAKADGAFTAHVHFAGPLPAGAELVTQLETLDGQPVGAAVTTPVSASPFIVQTRADAPATWSAETPHLHRARFTLRAGGRDLHTLAERFGFRTFEFRAGDGFYLNGAKLTFKGVNRHSFHADTGRTLSPRLNREDAQALKAANMNAVRMSHYPPDPEFLDLCDELGLYVLNELAGWQVAYDAPTARRLIAGLVARDVNHPSVLFWDNGNEGGWNPEVDDEFVQHDPQRRPVLRPGPLSPPFVFRGVNTRHYREYEETLKFSDGPDVFLPTEFLHGLFDGGHAAGLEDYWKIMGEKPHAAGGFLWVWADEAVARSDQGGRLEAMRDLAPDGIVGPRGEKSGSYDAIRDIWSPVQIPLADLPADFTGTLPVRNRHDFLNLRSVTFEWRLMKYAPPGALMYHRTLVAHGRFAGPDVPARTDGSLAVPLPADWRDSDALLLTAFDSRQRELWTWSWRWKSGAAALGLAQPAKSPVQFQKQEHEFIARAGRNEARFDVRTGQLLSLARDGRKISLGAGPRLVAYKRHDRTLEPVALPTAATFSGGTTAGPDAATLSLTSDGALRRIKWTLQSDGDLRLDYEIAPVGEVDLLGLDFDYPEEKMKSKEWLGAGPYRVWQNRLRGTQYGRWVVPYNDPIPGVTWDHQPEFKGWFARWDWVAFTTTEGRFALLNDSGSPYVGTYRPRDGLNNPVLVLPRLGLGVYQAIPAIGTKNSQPSNLGPQGQPRNFTEPIKGSLVIRLLDQP